MAVYSKLLLTTGGGIINAEQQAQQTTNTATVLIGLGGTGVHCIRTIKTQVYTRLKPDDEEAIVPQYSHIRFIGVDTAVKSRGGALTEKQSNEDESKKADAIMSLDDTEFFSIANRNVKQALMNPVAIGHRSELAWLEYEKIDAPNLTDAGAGGIRQVGRFMMMDKSEAFMAKVQQEINAAKRGLTSPHVNVHVFAGLSGGTGSGCFLDVCYMLRTLADTIGGVTIFGYFFLPDVNLSIIPFEDQNVRAYIPKNGYAAMQELDYCMKLQKNGGSFEQVYQGHKTIKWNQPPVDMCHLICATDKDNNEIADAYNYAMNVTAEYIMDFLTLSDKEFGLEEHLSNFQTKVNEANAKKTFGSEMAYCVLGASCASIPLREINTYLASELFNKFGSIQENTPSKADAETVLVNALANGRQSYGDIYDALTQEIYTDVTGDYARYPDTWQSVRDYGNKLLVKNYTDQTAAMENQIEANAKSMASAGNKDSLIGRLNAQLYDIMKDIDRGPIYVYRMFEAAQSHNLLNLTDGIIRENTARWQQEAAQNDLRNQDYNNAKSDFELRRNRKLFDTDASRFQAYEYYLMVAEQHDLMMFAYKKLDEVLRTFKAQLEEAVASYYIKLNRVMETLIDTFKENKNALANQKMLRAANSFTIPMMTIDELKPSLDKEIERVDIPNMLDQFMSVLLENKDAWITEDENSITKLVTEFFVKRAFSQFANRTITNFLRDKYQNKTHSVITDEQLINFIYDDWMRLLASKASPLFYFNRSIWDEDRTSRLAFLSFPAESSVIRGAAEKLNDANALWGLKKSALTDRIFIMCSACGLPLSSYNNCVEYERLYFTSKTAGRHYYEGKPIPGAEFTDWNQLPSITPQSVMQFEGLPADMAKLVGEARELYAQARELGILNADSQICEPDQEVIKQIEAACAACEEKRRAVKEPKELGELDELVNEVVRLNGRVPMTATGFAFPSDGHREKEEDILRIQEDHFVDAPVIRMRVRAIADQLAGIHSNCEAVVAAAQQTIAAIKEKGSTMTDYCDAVFTGVIEIEGRKVVYKQSNYGVVKEVVLSMRGDEFAFGSIPIYQGFVNYQQLPEELRKEIKNLANDRINKDAPELYTTGKALKELFTNDRVTAWAQLAADFPQVNEIRAFLSEFIMRFERYCKENGI